jgi:hypothetical protein
MEADLDSLNFIDAVFNKIKKKIQFYLIKLDRYLVTSKLFTR